MGRGGCGAFVGVTTGVGSATVWKFCIGCERAIWPVTTDVFPSPPSKLVGWDLSRRLSPFISWSGARFLAFFADPLLSAPGRLSSGSAALRVDFCAAFLYVLMYRHVAEEQ